MAQPYKIKSGADITVKSVAVDKNYILTDNKLLWTEFKDTIQNEVAYYDGLTLDTTNGRIRAM